MVFLIMGASHVGKTNLAQKLLEKYKYPYLSIDHLKMGLIRSGNTTLTPMDDNKLTDYLWPIVREIIKTAIENQQNLIIEGCYIPFDWQNDFESDYLQHIKHLCLIMTKDYIAKNIEAIKGFANIIEARIDDDIDTNELIEANAHALAMCKKHGLNYQLIDESYPADITEEIYYDKKDS